MAEVLATAVPPATMLAMLAAILSSYGVTKKAVGSVLYLVLAAAKRLPAAPGPAMAQTLTAEPAFRAAYLVNASVRVQNALNAGQSLDQALATEQRNLDAHIAAQANRRKAAAQVDSVAQDVSVSQAFGAVGTRGTVRLAGWKARMDAKTSPECRAADGKNFRLDRPPAIGYPGTVHLHCRCRAVKPYRHAPVMDPLAPASPHR